MKRFYSGVSESVRLVVVAAIVALVVGATGAVAADLLTGKDIKNNSIGAKELKKKLRTKINKGATAGTAGAAGQAGTNGTNGTNGAAGADGEDGDDGADGADGLDSGDPRVVTTGNLNGFELDPNGEDNGTVGTLTFETPPATPPLGTSALRYFSDNGKNVVAYVPFPGDSGAGIPGNGGAGNERPLLNELTTASYASLIAAASAPGPAVDLAFKFEVRGSTRTGGDGSGYSTVTYEPYQNGASSTKDEWHRHNVRQGKVWATGTFPSGNCTQAVPCDFDQFMSENPNARVLSTKIVVGQNSGVGFEDFIGFLDDVRLGFDGDFVRYDLGG